jgi:exodeoxyribonuclease X
MKLIVLDTETSNLDPAEGAAILELAWMVVDHVNGEWKPTAAHEMYIQHEGPIHPRAQASHHIRADWLTAERGAVPRTEAVEKLLQSIEPDSFAVAHNSEFDSKFLPEVTNSWICTFRAAKRMWPEAPGYGNQVLRYWLNVIPDLSMAPTIKARSPHQALYDVATTTGILLRMLRDHTPEELHQLSQPMLLKTIEFGKHKGKQFELVPRDYMTWLRDQPRLDDDLRFTLDHYIAQP